MDIMKKVTSKQKGSFGAVIYRKSLKTPKAISDIVEKITVANCRFGIEYDNLKSTKEGRVDGSKPAENAGLPWGKWKRYPYLIEHNGNEYLRCYLNSNGINSSYFLNGNRITREQAKAICLKSEFRENNIPVDTITVNMKNVIDVK